MSTMRTGLQLICHGMTLAWYVPETEQGKKDDKYRILVPQMDQMDLTKHTFLLGLGAGAVKPVLQYSTSELEPTKSYSLTFAAKTSMKMRQKKDPSQNLVFYKGTTSAVADPDVDPEDSNAGVAFEIIIPYPAADEEVRVNNFPENPFAGAAIEQFGLDRLTRLVEANVFSFDIDDINQDLILKNINPPYDEITIQKAPLTGLIKLHLYSQPTVPPSMSHLPMLTQMLTVGTDKIDLELNGEFPLQDNPDPDDLPVPAGLALHDLLNLSELIALQLPVAPAAKNAYNIEIEKEKLFTFDPAECGQGGGC